ncbi:hypothetical protein [Rathayibacter rathayi]|uniref:hypothetical protein n=1 Tax=Rathayibacter rathayi TaxID=33887 RepID=UPI0011B0EBB9|nr:hypothetical protein [Rathayibacter rathayi]
MPKKTRDVIVASSDWTVPSEDGVHRRTIVKGAAWTVPVVAVSMATPAAAASNLPTLAFTKASYSGTACSRITGVQVKSTINGTTPDPGKVVTVTLQDGYKFSDGSTSFTGTTDQNGLVTLPAIIVPATGGKSSFSANSQGLAAKPAPVTAPIVGGTVYVYRSSGETALSVTNAAQVVSDGTSGVFVVTDAGELQKTDGTVLATGLDPANTRVLAVNSANEPVYIKNGVFYVYRDGKENELKAKNLSQITADGTSGTYSVTKDGNLVSSDGTVVAKGLDPKNTRVLAENSFNEPVYIKDGKFYAYRNGKEDAIGATDLVQVVASGTSGTYGITKDGKLVDSSGKELATGLDPDNLRVLAVNSANEPVYLKDGVFYVYRDGKEAKLGGTDVVSVYSDGTSGVYGITKDGKLVDSSGTVLKSGGAEITGLDPKNVNGMTLNSSNEPVYIKPPTC